MSAGGDNGFAQAFHVGEQAGTAVFGDHLAQQPSEQAHVSAKLVRHLRDGIVSFGRSYGGHAWKASEFGLITRDRSHPLD
ncbi:hypothetical protein Pth03_16140 [Planotetraspora thailandica]|uniref:Uncharacterized protein n=1 Tax=Planotetraspora thailandica TaxID=487172 RepID=A0A8J3XUL6_9ACTN|nr:hypothetical protein Pth03_16140 [Planotetraspora thailandica]